MNDSKLKEYARKYAEEHLMSGCFNVNGEQRVEINDLAYFYETLLATILRTHCIVSKERVKEIYRACSEIIDKGLCGAESAIQRVSLLDDLFGESLF